MAHRSRHSQVLLHAGLRAWRADRGAEAPAAAEPADADEEQLRRTDAAGQVLACTGSRTIK